MSAKENPMKGSTLAWIVGGLAVAGAAIGAAVYFTKKPELTASGSAPTAAQTKADTQAQAAATAKAIADAQAKAAAAAAVGGFKAGWDSTLSDQNMLPAERYAAGFRSAVTAAEAAGVSVADAVLDAWNAAVSYAVAAGYGQSQAQGYATAAQTDAGYGTPTVTPQDIAKAIQSLQLG
jgi:hypothetical protein